MALEREALQKEIQEIWVEHRSEDALETALVKTRQSYQLDLEHYLLGLKAYWQNRFEDAIREFKRAIEINPELPLGAYNLVGNSYTSLGQYDAAIAWFNEAIKLAQGYSHAVLFYNKGVAYLRKNETKRAMASFYVALENNPAYSRPYLSLVGLLIGEGDFDRALQIADAAMLNLLEKEKDLVELSRRLAEAGDLLESDGKKDIAVSFFNKAVEVLQVVIKANPTSAMPLFELAGLHARRSQLTNAAEVLKKAILLNPELEKEAKKDAHLSKVFTLPEFQGSTA